jgi:hypothetical protein
MYTPRRDLVQTAVDTRRYIGGHKEPQTIGCYIGYDKDGRTIAIYNPPVLSSVTIIREYSKKANEEAVLRMGKEMLERIVADLDALQTEIAEHRKQIEEAARGLDPAIFEERKLAAAELARASDDSKKAIPVAASEPAPPLILAAQVEPAPGVTSQAQR